MHSYKLELEYHANKNNREFSEITSAEYQLNQVQIFHKKSTTVAPVGLHVNTNFKIPVFNKKDEGTVSFHSMIAQIEILDSTVKMVLSGYEHILDKQAPRPTFSNSYNGIRKRASTTIIPPDGSQLLSPEFYV